jgi:hypothetical protein
MSDKKLLSEHTVRRFMKLANVAALSGNFIQENFNEEEDNENNDNNDNNDVQEEGAMSYAREDEEDDLAPVADSPAEDDLEVDAELGLDDEAPVEGGVADISLTEEEAQLLVDLGERLGAALGPAEELPPDEPVEDEPVEDEPVEDEFAVADEEEVPVMEQEALIQEILKRVTKRIISEKLKKNK